MMAGFGLVGIALHRFGCDPVPLLLGFILGPMMEENLRRALLLSAGDTSVFFTRPLSLAFLVVSVLLVAVSLLPALNKKREDVFAEDN